MKRDIYLSSNSNIYTRRRRRGGRTILIVVVTIIVLLVLAWAFGLVGSGTRTGVTRASSGASTSTTTPAK